MLGGNTLDLTPAASRRMFVCQVLPPSAPPSPDWGSVLVFLVFWGLVRALQRETVAILEGTLVLRHAYYFCLRVPLFSGLKEKSRGKQSCWGPISRNTQPFDSEPARTGAQCGNQCQAVTLGAELE